VDDPVLVPQDALRGVTVGISVSDSADLARLGLSEKHCELAVAELARAIFIAGGTLVYGGRLKPAGFTDVLLDEVRRYRGDRDALILCVPISEHQRLGDAELVRIEDELHTSAVLECLDAHGEPIDVRRRSDLPPVADVAAGLTAMRRHITDRCDARVVVGGRLQGSRGAMPGVVEEALLSIEAAGPLYIAGGFGGAAAAVAHALGHDDGAWFPPSYPDGLDEHNGLVDRLRAAANKTSLPNDGLSEGQRRQLAVTHRPGDIASLVVTGLALRGC
jgi:hypothetical protein